MNRFTRLVALLSCSCFISAPAGAVQASKTRTASPPSDAPPVAKVIAYGQRDVVRLRTKVRYSTLIVLPPNEMILDFVVGDRDLWVIEGNQNLAYVKPAKESSQTNLNLITASGNVYSFLLMEVSGTAGVEPDLKVYIEAKDASMQEAASGPRRFVAARELDDVRQEAQHAKEETRHLQETSQTEINQGITKFVTNVRFAYSFAAGKKPFYVRAMYHDDNFTYIQARPEETPTLYELKDGKQNLVNFTYSNGVYVIDKILDRGYLAVGKQKLVFKREE